MRTSLAVIARLVLTHGAESAAGDQPAAAIRDVISHGRVRGPPHPQWSTIA